MTISNLYVNLKRYCYRHAFASRLRFSPLLQFLCNDPLVDDINAVVSPGYVPNQRGEMKPHYFLNYPANMASFSVDVDISLPCIKSMRLHYFINYIRG